MKIQKSKILSVNKVQNNNQYVYDIEMQDTPNTFFANNILVHNSIFIGLNNMSDQFLQTEVKQFDKWYLQNIVKKYNPNINEDYYIMQLQHQKTFTHLYFGEGKKRYYGIQKNGEKYIRGLNIIRKDCPLFMRSKLDQLAQLSVKQQLMLHHLQDTMQLLLQADYSQIGVFKRFTKDFDDYIKKDQHVTAAKYANQIYGTRINRDDVPLLFNIITLNQNQLKVKDRHRAICLLQTDLHIIDQNKDKFIIDYKTYFDKQCITPLMQFGFIESCKWIIQEYKKLHRDFYPFRPSMLCPVCQKKHAKLTPAKSCVSKFIAKIKKSKQQTTVQQKEIISKISEYLKHFEE